MTATNSGFFRHGPWVALVLLVVILGAAASAFLMQQHERSIATQQEEARTELRLLGTILTEALRRNDFQSIEPFIQEWGSTSSDTVDLSLTADNGFVLGSYRRTDHALHELTLRTRLTYSYSGGAELVLCKSLDDTYAARRTLGAELAAAVLLLSAAFWFLLHTLARRRLEAEVLREEVRQRIQAEQALIAEKQRVETTLHSIGDAVITTDPQGRVTYMNPVAEQLTGWSEAEARGQALPMVFHIVDETTRKPGDDPVARALATGTIVGLANHTVLIRRGGGEHAIEDSAAPIRHPDGRVLGAVMVFKDATEKRLLIQKISHQARHDELTGLVNRSEFNRHLNRALEAVRETGAQHALYYLDLDQFKVVNDTCGHFAGDALLQQVSNLLRSHARAGDIVARLGGDEFGVLLENCPIDKARDIATTICHEIAAFHFTWEDKVFEFGASIGLVPITALAASPMQLLSQADVACYTAKDLGRNRVHVYAPDDEDLSRRQRELQWASRLSGALTQNRFRLYCQPIQRLGLHHGTVATDHYEVLLRMVDNDGGEILPDTFIPAAERYNLMPAIDRWVIRNAFHYYAEYLCAKQGVEFSINLSGTSLNEPDLQRYIEEQLAHFAIPARAICFEITETAVIHNISRARSFIGSMKQLGFRFSLDDFGSGLSSFAYLKSLPVDYLKIDGNFVQDVVEDPVHRVMVDAINNIGHAMGLQTIAEFVENEAIAGILRDLGVDYAQGYGIGHPRPIEQTREAEG